jgi:Flp pilus assembly pilin Flp
MPMAGIPKLDVTKSIDLSYIIRLMNCKRGQTLVEYALILTFVTLAIFGVLGILGDELTNFYNAVVNQLENTA